jgi:putative MATE family efflux protein
VPSLDSDRRRAIKVTGGGQAVRLCSPDNVHHRVVDQVVILAISPAPTGRARPIRIGAEIRAMVRPIVRLAGPSLIENLMQTALGIVSMLMVARLGPAAIAGVGLSNQFANLLIMSFSGLAVGNTALVARHVGAVDTRAAASVARQALIVATAIGCLIGLAAFLASEPALRATGAEDAVVEAGAEYLKIIGSAAILMILMQVGGGTLRGAGDTVTPMLATLVMNVVNIAVAYVLIFGHLGFPALGIVGAAWAAVIARTLGAILILRKLVRGGRTPALGWFRAWRPDTGTMRRIVRIGGPASIESFTVQIGLMLFSLIAVQVGTAAFAAQQIVFNVAQLSLLPGMAFSVAATTLVGQSLGAKEPRRAVLSGWLAVSAAVIWMSTMAVGYVVLAEPWMRLYTGDGEIVRLGITVMWILALGQPLQAMAFVLSGALRGAGDTRVTMWGGMLGTWGFRVPLAWFLGIVLGFGLIGIWVGWIMDWLVRSLIYFWRFRSGRWQKISV